MPLCPAVNWAQPQGLLTLSGGLRVSQQLPDLNKVTVWTKADQNCDYFPFLFFSWQDRNLEVALHMAIEFCPVLHSAQL